MIIVVYIVICYRFPTFLMFLSNKKKLLTLSFMCIYCLFINNVFAVTVILYLKAQYIHRAGFVVNNIRGRAPVLNTFS